MEKIVGIGEMVISSESDDTIKTFALASCVGIVAYVPGKKAGGMLHIALPDCRTEKSDASGRCYYANSGVGYFINKICKEVGCSKADLLIGVFGGADSIRDSDVFSIGKKNIEIVMKILNEMNLKVVSEETGGNVSRTITLSLESGEVIISRHKIII